MRKIIYFIKRNCRNFNKKRKNYRMHTIRIHKISYFITFIPGRKPINRNSNEK